MPADDYLHLVEKCDRLTTELESAEAGRQYWMREALERNDGEDATSEVRRLAAQVEAHKAENQRLQEALTECTQLSLAMAGRFDKQHRDLIETHMRLRAFVDWVLDEMKDGGDLDGGTFQDNAQRLGILVETRPKEPCEEGCVCAEYYSAEEFTQGEAKCFVRSTLVGGKEPAPPLTCPTCQGGGLAITTDQGAGCPSCGKVG